MIYNQDNIVVSESTFQDVIHMQPYIRQDDINELSALGINPYQALEDSYNDSLYKYTIKLHNNPIGMFGINPDNLIGDKARIWLLSTEHLVRIQRRFARHSRKFVKEALEQYPVLYNYVDARNEKAINWLKWLGANFINKVKYGINGEEFYYFEFSSKKEIVNIFSNDVDMPPRKKIMLFENILKKHPDAIFAGDALEPPCKHEFTDGIYTRTITIPKGMVLTGEIHKHDHPNFLMKGKVQVYTEFGGIEYLEAPKVMMSKAGTKRVVLTLEETVWSTVHLNPTNERDPDKLKKMLTIESYDKLETAKENIPCLCG